MLKINLIIYVVKKHYKTLLFVLTALILHSEVFVTSDGKLFLEYEAVELRLHFAHSILK